MQRFAQGAKSVGEDVEVKVVRLYDIDYKGCMSCMAFKLKGKYQGTKLTNPNEYGVTLDADHDHHAINHSSIHNNSLSNLVLDRLFVWYRTKLT